MTCDTCGEEKPLSKFNLESFSPETCFRCRVESVDIGFGGFRDAFHGDTLVGGTIKSDNEHTINEGRANGYDPVPAKAPNPGVSGSELARLKKTLTGGGG
jgi:hypothetical protein